MIAVALSLGLQPSSEPPASAIPEGLRFRIVVCRPVLAIDQCFTSEILIENPTDSVVAMEAVSPTFFEPEIRLKGSREPVKPTEQMPVEQSERNWQFWHRTSYGPSSSYTTGSDDHATPAPFSYRYGGKLWKLSPGEYTLGGVVRVRTSSGVERLIGLSPVDVSMWAPMSDEQVERSAASVWERFGQDPEKLWRELAALVKPGMRQSVVRKILLPKKELGFFYYPRGGSYFKQYPLDDKWWAQVRYDYTAVGVGQGASDSENRIISVKVVQQSR